MADLLLGFDVVGIVLTAAFVVFWGSIIVAFIVLYDYNPYAPRKYYNVKIEDKDGKERFKCKAWIITKEKVKWLRIGLKDFPSFKSIVKDIAYLSSINEKGDIVLIEDVPDKFIEDNYRPKNIPITQREKFIESLGNMVNEEGREAFVLKVREEMERNSRLVDLNTSRATKEYIAQARREAERVATDNWIVKYGAIIGLIIACLFTYLIMDGAQKSWQATMGQQTNVMEYGYSQIIAQCGGVYRPYQEPVKNETKSTTPSIPFITT